LRYVLLAAPALITAFYIWELCGLPRLRSAPRLVCYYLPYLLPFNTKAGFEWRHWYKEGMDKVEAEILSGNPPSQIAERNRVFLVHWWDDTKLGSNAYAQKSRNWPFSKMKGMKQFRKFNLRESYLPYNKCIRHYPNQEVMKIRLSKTVFLS
jgi:hypothetical protein